MREKKMRHLKEVVLSSYILKLNEIDEGGAQEGVLRTGDFHAQAVRSSETLEN